MTWHQTIIVGNLGRDPEIRYFQDGNSVCSFAVAVNESWNDRRTGEKRERTTWYQVSAWGALGDTCQRNLSRGSRVMVIGSVSVRAYMNREGLPAASLDMRSREVRFIDTRRDERDAYESGGRSGGYGGSPRGNYGRDSFAPPARAGSPEQFSRQDDADVYIPDSAGEEKPAEQRYDDTDDIPF